MAHGDVIPIWPPPDPSLTPWSGHAHHPVVATDSVAD